MFEKEAEEYAKRNNPAEYGVRATYFTVLDSFKDGAKFGYNKAMVKELDDISRNYIHCKTCTRLDDFLAGLKAALDIKDTSDKRLEPILYKLKDLGIIES